MPDPSLLLPNGSFKFLRDHTFTPAELKAVPPVLQIDESYQRIEHKTKVRELMRVLEHGGKIPDPIWVAQRPDKSLWVVDGQQRYWACWATETPLPARIYSVADRSVEVAVFHILNHRQAMIAAHVAITWPGAGGDLLRWINEESALTRRLAAQSSAQFPASTVAKTLTCALAGSGGTNSIRRTMEKLDALAIKSPGRAKKTAEMLSVILVNVFPDGKKMPSLAGRAIGVACYGRWNTLTVRQAWPMPNRGEYTRLSKLDWHLVSPDQRYRWLPVVVDEINKRWKAA